MYINTIARSKSFICEPLCNFSTLPSNKKVRHYYSLKIYSNIGSLSLSKKFESETGTTPPPPHPVPPDNSFDILILWSCYIRSGCQTFPSTFFYSDNCLVTTVFENPTHPPWEPTEAVTVVQAPAASHGTLLNFRSSLDIEEEKH
jgi:hypothetical protein